MCLPFQSAFEWRRVNWLIHVDCQGNYPLVRNVQTHPEDKLPFGNWKSGSNRQMNIGRHLFGAISSWMELPKGRGHSNLNCNEKAYKILMGTNLKIYTPFEKTACKTAIVSLLPSLHGGMRASAIWRSLVLVNDFLRAPLKLDPILPFIQTPTWIPIQSRV